MRVDTRYCILSEICLKISPRMEITKNDNNAGSLSHIPVRTRERDRILYLLARA